MSNEPDKSSSGNVLVDERLHRAHRAFAGADFATTISILNDVPDSERSSEMTRLLHRAREFLGNGPVVPREDGTETPKESDRSPEPSGNNPESPHSVDTDEVLRSARRYLQQHRFTDAIVLLESVPPGARNSQIASLWEQLEERMKEEAKSRDEILHQWQQAVEAPDDSDLDELRSCLEQNIRSHPDDVQTIHRLELLQDFAQHLEERTVGISDASEMYSDGDFAAVLQRLDDLPEELHTGKVFDLYSESEDSLARTQAVGRSLLSNRDQENEREVMDCISWLDSLEAEPAAVLRNGLEPAEFVPALRSVVIFSMTEPESTQFVQRLLDELNADESLALCHALGAETVESIDETSPYALKSKLSDIVDELRICPRELIDVRLSLLRPLRPVLDDRAETIAAWQRFLVAAEQYREIQRHDWSRRDSILRSTAAETLEERAHRLAAAVDRVLPRNCDRMQRLEELLGEPLRSDRRVLKCVNRKIKRFLRTGQWPAFPLTILSYERLPQAASLIAGILAVLLAVGIAHMIIAGIGGVLGFVMMFGLASLWAFFCIALYRVM